jgi:hypothetical protein
MSAREQPDNIGPILARLQVNHLLHNEEEYAEFEEALDELEGLAILTLEQVSALYALFTDQAQAAAPLWRLLHLLEHLDEEQSLQVLADVTATLTSQAPDWLAILWSRTLHSSQAVSLLRSIILPLLSDDLVHELQVYLLQLATEDTTVLPMVQQLWR